MINHFTGRDFWSSLQEEEKNAVLHGKLMGRYNRAVGDQNAKRHVHSGILAQDILAANKNSNGSWTREHSFYNLAKVWLSSTCVPRTKVRLN